MATTTEIEEQDSEVLSGADVSRLRIAQLLGISLLVSVWMWAAFLRKGEWPLYLQLAALAGGFIAVALAGRSLVRMTQTRFGLQPCTGTDAVVFSFSGFCLLAVFLPEYLLGKGPALARSLVLLLCSVLLSGAYLAISLRYRPAFLKRLNFVSAGAVVAVFGVLYFLMISYLSVRKLHAFGYVGQDIAYFTQCLYTTLHGHLFYSNMYHDLLYGKPVTSDFAGHNQLVLGIFLPFYALHQSAATLLVVRNAFVVLCAWPVWLIGRRTLSPGLAALAAVTFLLIPAVIYQGFYDFAPLSLAGFPLLFAIYFFLENRFRPFLITALLTLTVREDLVFAVFGLGLLALWQRRPVRWIALPCAMAAGWAFLSWKIILPYFLQGATSAVASCFSYMGDTPGQMLRGMLAHPGMLLSRGNLIYMKQMTDSFGGVLFLGSPAWLLSTPYVAINVLGQGGGCNTAMMYRHYSLIPVVLLFAAFMMTVQRVTTRRLERGRDPSPVQAALVFFVLAAAVCSLVFVTGPAQTEDLRARPWHEEARAVVALIPPGASVAAPRYLLPELANRGKLYQSLRLLEYHTPDAEFVILDKDWDRMSATDQWRDNYKTLARLLARRAEYRVVYDSPGYIVYQRCAGCKVDLKAVAAAAAFAEGPHE
jgi:uncharacterized membrane protein